MQEMKQKTYRGKLEFKADDQLGMVRAVFSSLGVEDHDNEITAIGAFTEGEKVILSSWGHGWGDLPVGKGEIHSDVKEAWMDGMFFLDTGAGRETYLTVKGLAELQEWSYGFEVLESEYQNINGKQVRILKKLRVIEVSPVLQGAGIGTHTVAIKEGRRNNAKDLEDIQGVHDAAARLGAMCDTGDNATGDEGNPKGQGGRPSPQPSPSREREMEPSKVMPRDIQRRIEIDTILLR
jgi:hypothetical protein